MFVFFTSPDVVHKKPWCHLSTHFLIDILPNFSGKIFNTTKTRWISLILAHIQWHWVSIIRARSPQYVANAALICNQMGDLYWETCIFYPSPQILSTSWRYVRQLGKLMDCKSGKSCSWYWQQVPNAREVQSMPNFVTVHGRQNHSVPNSATL